MKNDCILEVAGCWENAASSTQLNLKQKQVKQYKKAIFGYKIFLNIYKKKLVLSFIFSCTI